MNYNETDELGYIIEGICFAIGASILYKMVYLENIIGINTLLSKLILIGILLLTIILNCCLTIGWGRNLLSNLSATAIGCAVYAILSLNQYINHLLQNFIIIEGVVLGLYFFMKILIKYPGNYKKNQTDKKSKFQKIYVFFRSGTAIASGIFLMILLIQKTLGYGVIKPNIEQFQNVSIESCIDTIKLCKEEQWATLSTQERINVLQCIADIEQANLRLPVKNIIIRCDTIGTSNPGTYDSSSREITFSSSYIMYEQPFELINTISHEMYFAAIDQYIESVHSLNDVNQELIFFKNAFIYEQELELRKSNIEHFISREFECEKDARSYESDRGYLYWIILSETEGGQ